jgi:hydrogenase expression/formation protein HypC
MMCLGIPGLVTELDSVDTSYAWVDVSGAKRRVNVALLTDDAVGPGDWVLIHVGFALARINYDLPLAILALRVGMANAYTDELAAMGQSVIGPPSKEAAPVVDEG